MHIVLYILIIYLILNLVALMMYRADKRKAEKNQYRTSENTLLLAALIGPFGAYAGMKKYHHKTRKMKFKLVFVFMALHIVIAALVIFEFM